jgi:3-hydroxyisobutyrate dehydrogenase-like beta-hydroxyacid dehydrogenase
MARVLHAGGYTVRGWNRSPLPQDSLDGITLASSLADAASSDILLLMLSDSRAVAEMLEGLEPHLSSGQLVLDMGSSDPRHSKAHAKRLAQKDIGWVDAPVSGGPEGAKGRDGGGER